HTWAFWRNSSRESTFAARTTQPCRTSRASVASIFALASAGRRPNRVSRKSITAWALTWAFHSLTMTDSITLNPSRAFSQASVPSVRSANTTTRARTALREASHASGSAEVVKGASLGGQDDPALQDVQGSRRLDLGFHLIWHRGEFVLQNPHDGLGN